MNKYKINPMLIHFYKEKEQTVRANYVAVLSTQFNSHPYFEWNLLFHSYQQIFFEKSNENRKMSIYTNVAWFGKFEV